MPTHLAPMLAKPGRLPREDERWAFEVKWDGVRAIAYWHAGHLRIEGRKLNDIGSRYPELHPLGRQLGAREAVLDGEIVAFDEHGAPSFELLQKRMHLTSEDVIRRLSQAAPVTYMIFDLLYLDGHLVTGLPYRERRSLLERLELSGPAWQTPANHVGDGASFLAVTAEHGLEGVLAKRLDSPYRAGGRGGEWLKIKNVGRQELVVGGWLPGKGRRSGQIGALLMGYYEQPEQAQGVRELRYAGRVGTGFDEHELQHLAAELNARRRPNSPFGKRGIRPPRNARFAEPELVAEIEFSHWTRERILRHSAYKGLRFDKPAEEVELEGSAVLAPAALEGSTVPAPATSASLPTASAPGAATCPSEAPYEVLRQTKHQTEIEVQGRTLRLSNREKLMYPQADFTKGQLIDYYAAIGPLLLRHLAARPLTLKRYPNGVEEPYFYEKRCPSHRPEWVRTAPVWTERVQEEIDYCLAEDLPTLIWAANLAAIELHTSLSRAQAMDTPSAMVFDLDPGTPPERPDVGLRACCRVALWIRELLDAFALRSLVKTSGAKGLQVYVPLNTPVNYAQTKPFARAVAELLAKTHPRQVVSRMAKELRAGKVLIDWSQNDIHKTTVSAYSLRARARPTISTPLTWEEVEQAVRSRRTLNLSAEPTALLERVARLGDLFAPLLDLTQELPDLSTGAAAALATESIDSAALPAAVPPASAAVGHPAHKEADQPQQDRKDQHIPKHVRRKAQAPQNRQEKHKNHQSNHVQYSCPRFRRAMRHL
jgi:bifunctional non-homologous end joining protein LigD